MSDPDYVPLFLAEAREQLQALTLAVVRVEEHPGDRETIDEIFRIAHSLKGTSATMGFGAMAALTHQMEDVFELLRQRRDGLGRAAIDCLLECVDAIEADLGSIERTGREDLDPSRLAARLRRLVRRRSPEQHHARLGGGDDPEVALARAAGRRVHRVLVRLAEGCPMPAVRAYMALEALAACGELLGSTPSRDGAERFAGRTIEAFVAGAASDEALAAAARAITDVADVLVEEELPAEPAAAPAAPESAAGRPAGATTVRIDVDRLDQLMQHVSELVAHRSRLESLPGAAAVPGLPQAMQGLTDTIRDLQAATLQMRMVPLAGVLGRVPRLTRDLSARLGKQVELVVVGKDIELDRAVVEALGDPLIHLVRNALAHGLETPEQRLAGGKPAAGILEIAVRRSATDVVITVRDDGAGVVAAHVAEKAVEQGLLSAGEAASVDTGRAVELLFAPGFTTVAATSDVAGRGVGMDVVRSAVRALGGDVTMRSSAGLGSTVQIVLPARPAVLAALEVEVGGRPWAIPLERVERTLRLVDHAIGSSAGTRTLQLRDGAVPLVDAASVLGLEGAQPAEVAVVVHGPGGRVGLLVERLVGRRDVLTRPDAARSVGDGPGAASAVLDDGAVVPVLDCDAALSAAGAVTGLAA